MHANKDHASFWSHLPHPLEIRENIRYTQFSVCMVHGVCVLICCIFINSTPSNYSVINYVFYQKYEGRIGHGMVFEAKAKVSLDWSRRFLVGPGSSPPLCTSKCGNCTPCRPVHVTVPPGTPVTAEYYPEAWRCKCGNKLNMP